MKEESLSVGNSRLLPTRDRERRFLAVADEWVRDGGCRRAVGRDGSRSVRNLEVR